MKQCEPLKEPLNAPKECAPCPRNRRRMPMGHVGIVASEPVTGASDLVAVDVRTQELPKVFILREQYDNLDPAVIREKQEEAHCILVPVEQEVFDRIQQEAVVINTQPSMPDIPEMPEIIFENAPRISIYDSGKHGGNKTPRIPPKDYAKKKKAKRRQQKSSRKRH